MTRKKGTARLLMMAAAMVLTANDAPAVPIDHTPDVKPNLLAKVGKFYDAAPAALRRLIGDTKILVVHRIQLVDHIQQMQLSTDNLKELERAAGVAFHRERLIVIVQSRVAKMEDWHLNRLVIHEMGHLLDRAMWISFTGPFRTVFEQDIADLASNEKMTAHRERLRHYTKNSQEAFAEATAALVQAHQRVDDRDAKYLALYEAAFPRVTAATRTRLKEYGILSAWPIPDPLAQRTSSAPFARQVAPQHTQERSEHGSQRVAITPVAQPIAAVAQKVVLYEEDPGDPNGKRFVGSVMWRTETVMGPGQQSDLAIRADVEVPERKLAMTWMLRRNTNKDVPATHTVEITFKPPVDFATASISNVPGILMKQAEQTRGVPLARQAVKVTNRFYLIGLSNLDADKARNIQMLKERTWFDLPVVYSNNRRAILAMEKGTPGDRAFAEAFENWERIKPETPPPALPTPATQPRAGALARTNSANPPVRAGGGK